MNLTKLLSIGLRLALLVEKLLDEVEQGVAEETDLVPHVRVDENLLKLLRGPRSLPDTPEAGMTHDGFRFLEFSEHFFLHEFTLPYLLIRLLISLNSEPMFFIASRKEGQQFSETRKPLAQTRHSPARAITVFLEVFLLRKR